MTVAPSRTITIGTRRSKLAQWQTRRVAELIEAASPGVSCHAVEFTTAGDEALDRRLPEIGGKGVFTLELEEALRTGRIDAAVHSLKDLPIEDSADLTLGAVCERADARDVLLSREHESLDALPKGARVGTSSTRRRAQLLALRPDLDVRPLRGNVDSRVRKAEAGDYDGIVIAAAGAIRLGFQEAITEYLSLELVLPAPGQGALAVQCRADDEPIETILATIDEASCRAAVTAERAFLAGLGGGCAAPVGAYAQVDGADRELHLRGVVAAADGERVVRSDIRGPARAAGRLGQLAAASARTDGAEELLP